MITKRCQAGEEKALYDSGLGCIIGAHFTWQDQHGLTQEIERTEAEFDPEAYSQDSQ